MNINGKIVKYVFIAGLILICVLLLMILFMKENNDSQINSVAIPPQNIGNERILPVVDSKEPILENTGSEKVKSSKSITTSIDPNNELTFMDKDITNELVKKSIETLSNNIYRNSTPEEYIKIGGQWEQVRYSLTREVITKDKLPILYKLLDNDEYAPYWHKVVAAIGYISDDPNSVNVLLKFSKRNDNSKVDMHSIMGKSWAFAMIGLIGGDTADSILRKSVTKEGAKELTKEWIDEKPLPGRVNNEGMITFIQRHSITGLVLSGNPENLALVEKLYNEQKEISIRNHKRTELMSDLISSMAEKDYIADVGLETYLNEFDSGLDTGAMTPYLNKYRFELGN